VVERLEGHPARQRAVADDRDDLLVRAAGVARLREPHRHGDRVRCVPRVEDIVGRLVALGEAADAAVLPQRGEPVATAGEKFEDVPLMADIPDHAVARGVQCAQDAECQLDDAEVGREVSAGLRHRVDELVTDLFRQHAQLRAIERLEVFGSGDGIEDAIAHSRCVILPVGSIA